jgi:hypothetical protein
MAEASVSSRRPVCLWVIGGLDRIEFRKSSEIAFGPEPRCHPVTRKVVGAAVFDPAAPRAQVPRYALSRNLLRSYYCKTLIWRQLQASSHQESPGYRATPPAGGRTGADRGRSVPLHSISFSSVRPGRHKAPALWCPHRAIAGCSGRWCAAVQPLARLHRHRGWGGHRLSPGADDAKRCRLPVRLPLLVLCVMFEAGDQGRDERGMTGVRTCVSVVLTLPRFARQKGDQSL